VRRERFAQNRREIPAAGSGVTGTLSHARCRAYSVAVQPYQASARALASEAESANDILWVTYRWMSVGLGITGLVA
jgi:hypothetical protein